MTLAPLPGIQIRVAADSGHGAAKATGRQDRRPRRGVAYPHGNLCVKPLAAMYQSASRALFSVVWAVRPSSRS
jgi:hypothetical protein